MSLNFEGIKVVQTEPLFSDQDEWTKIAEMVELTILPQLEASRPSFLVTPKTFRLGSSVEPVKPARSTYHRIPVPPKFLVAHIGFLLQGRAVVTIGEKTTVLEASCVVFCA